MPLLPHFFKRGSIMAKKRQKPRAPGYSPAQTTALWYALSLRQQTKITRAEADREW
jgi:hypothetical protein